MLATDALRYQIIHYRLGALHGQQLVVGGIALVIGMAGNLQPQVRILQDDTCHAVEDASGLSGEFV